jgi:pseudouridine-5'-phosphate glycosidase
MPEYPTAYPIRAHPRVSESLRAGGPVVALESTIVAHGLPRPDNLTVARDVEQEVRAHGAEPATIGMIDGEIWVGLDDDQLATLATADDVAKLSVRDLPVAAVKRVNGATTVASTAGIAASVGIPVFATGGLGGVHRDATRTFDESADLTTLAHTRIAVVCAGVKSILDVPATLERLETLGVTVLGYRTTRFPGFFVADSGYDIDWSVDSPDEVAEVLRAQRDQGGSGGIGATAVTGVGDAIGGVGGGVIVANPLPFDEQLDPALHERTLADGLEIMERDGVSGKAVTPFLLAHFHNATEGRSLAVNVRIILRNAALAARIAVALSAATRPSDAPLFSDGISTLFSGGSSLTPPA